MPTLTSGASIGHYATHDIPNAHFVKSVGQLSQFNQTQGLNSFVKNDQIKQCDTELTLPVKIKETHMNINEGQNEEIMS
jgi:hypothetical protein